MNIGALIRRNRLYDFSYISTSPGLGADAVTDVIIEANSFDIADRAIVLGGMDRSTSRVLIRRNRYREVGTRLSVSPHLADSGYLVLENERQE